MFHVYIAKEAKERIIDHEVILVSYGAGACFMCTLHDNLPVAIIHVGLVAPGAVAAA